MPQVPRSNLHFCSAILLQAAFFALRSSLHAPFFLQAPPLGSMPRASRFFFRASRSRPLAPGFPLCGPCLNFHVASLRPRGLEVRQDADIAARRLSFPAGRLSLLSCGQHGFVARQKIRYAYGRGRAGISRSELQVPGNTGQTAFPPSFNPARRIARHAIYSGNIRLPHRGAEGGATAGLPSSAVKSVSRRLLSRLNRPMANNGVAQAGWFSSVSQKCLPGTAANPECPTIDGCSFRNSGCVADSTAPR